MLNDLESVFSRLCQHLITNEKEHRQNVTILIGAGCSLSSSPKNITTEYIIRDLVEKHANGRPVPTDSFELAKAFDSWVWTGQARCNKIELLEEYFRDMRPADGYKQIRFLVENHYINNIITTNFDLMLDKVFQGLSYQLLVGNNCEELLIGNDPQFNLIKAHGDLNYGDLLFSQNELQYLSSPLAMRIRELTKGIIIVIGYSAQDASILSSFDTTAEYSAYWITYSEPNQKDTSKTKAMLDLLKRRNSESNLLYGADYGDFDKVVQKICENIQESEKPTFTALASVWNDKIINPHLTCHKRFHTLQQNLMTLLEKKLSKSTWRINTPYYSDSHILLLKATIALMQSSVLPHAILSIVTNEIEALLVSLGLAIWTGCQGYSFSASGIVSELQKDFESNYKTPIIKKSFWDVLLKLANVEKIQDLCFNKEYHEVQFAFDQSENHVNLLKRIDVYKLSKIIFILRKLLYFEKTSTETSTCDSIIELSYKKTLEKHLYNISNTTDEVCVELRDISRTTYAEIYKDFLKQDFREEINGNRVTLLSSNIYVDIFLNASNDLFENTPWENLRNKAITSTKEYMSNFASAQYTPLRSTYLLNSFLKSANSGLILTGESGSGKTILLKQWIDSLDSTEYLVIPIRGANNELNYNLGQLIFSDFLQYDYLEFINTSLAQHEQMLILVFDGVSEIQGNYSYVEKFYEKLLGFCDYIFENEYQQMRLIISVRSDFYNTLKRNSGISPKRGSFYTIMEDNNECEVAKLKQLTQNEIKILCNFLQERNGLKRTIDVDYLSQFGDIISSPLYLNLLSQTISATNNIYSCETKMMIYRNWFEHTLTQARCEQINKLTIESIIQYVIDNRYFEDGESKLNTGQLSRNLRHLFPDILDVYSWLTEKQIFMINTQPPNQIRYTHDSVEEYFLTERLLFLEEDGLLQWSRRAATLQTNPIVQHSIQNILGVLLEKDNLKLVNLFVTATRENINGLIMQFHRGFMTLSVNSFMLEKILDFYKNIETFLLKDQYTKNVYNFISMVEQEIDNSIDPGKQIIDILGQICLETHCRNEKYIVLLYKLVKAKYTFYFETAINTEAYYDASLQCESIIEQCDAQVPFSFTSKLNMLYAVILRNLGRLNDAIKVMEQTLEEQRIHASPDEICLSIIELGAMYRDMTLFDKALTLYSGINLENVINPLYVNRIHMQAAIVHKNRIQNAIFDKNITDEISKEYHRCYKKFNEIYSYAKSSNSIALLLDVIYELIETSVIGYTLSQITINEILKWGDIMDNEIEKYPIPLRKIQCYRMWGRIYEIKNELDEALQILISGFDLAISHNIVYRAVDCCNQITGIICRNINNSLFINDNRIQQGLLYGKYAIDYYSKLNQEEHRYLRDAIQKYEIIKKQYDSLI